MTATLYTVTVESLQAEAANTERRAADNLQAWTILGQTDKYAAAMSQAAALRSAAAARTVADRREILRNAGFTVKTPRAARA